MSGNEKEPPLTKADLERIREEQRSRSGSESEDSTASSGDIEMGAAWADGVARPPPELPTNPLDMRGLCVKVDSQPDGWAHIYLLRYQTPAMLMETLNRLTFQVYKALNDKYFGNATNGLIGLGYFYLSYDGKGVRDGKLSAKIYDTDSIGNATESMGTGKPTITTLTFQNATANVPGFTELVNAVIYKAFLELFIQSNLRDNVPFEYRVGIDIYANRNKAQANFFHKDATPSIPTKFFTLTYIISKDPNIVIKGPTIVTAKDKPMRASVTPAVRHGTTVGIDNTLVLHATPDESVFIPTRRPRDWRLAEIPYQRETTQFMLSDTRNSADYSGPELAPDPAARERQIEKIQFDTRETDRAFIRTWYITDFPYDPEAHTVGISGLTLRMDYMAALITEISASTCIVDTGITMPGPKFIARPEVKRMSLGGAETVEETLAKPLQYEEPLVKKEGDLITSSEESIAAPENEPNIASVFDLPKFRELLASTDNFILGDVVKGVALPKGGLKRASRSKRGKRKTIKRSKRAKTRRRMGGRKQKTRIRIKHTKTKRNRR
jgi:hypothetical protein